MTQVTNWPTARVSEVSESIQYGHTASADDMIDGPRFLRITDIQDGRVDWSAVPSCLVTAKELDKYRLRENDIVFARTGATTGKSFLIERCPEAVFASYLIRLRLKPGVEPKYVAYFFQSPKYWAQIERGKRGSGQPGVNAQVLGEVELPIAPAHEQEAIVSEVEKHLSRVDVGATALKRVQANLKRYRASVLKAACEGHLVPTEAELARRESREYEPASVLLQRILKERRRHWEASELAKLKAKGKPPTDDRWKSKYKAPEPADAKKLPPLPEGWCWTTIDAVADLTIGFAFKSSGFVDEGIRLLRGENIEPGRLRWLDTRCWPTADSSAYENLLVQEGDVILAMDRPVVSAGLKLAQAKSSDIPCLLVQRVARLRLFNGDNRLLFMTMSEDRFIRHVVVGGQTGTQLPHVSGSRIANYPVALPPAAEQARVIGDVQRRFSTVEYAETMVNADLVRAERLRQSILQAAFEGRLTPVGGAERPSPESASGGSAKHRATAALVELADV